jgi:hypothetical protein
MHGGELFKGVDKVLQPHVLILSDPGGGDNASGEGGLNLLQRVNSDD